MTIYLIRHGRTEANDRHLYCGSTDLPLSREGAEELRTLHYSCQDAVFLTSGTEPKRIFNVSSVRLMPLVRNTASLK